MIGSLPWQGLKESPETGDDGGRGGGGRPGVLPSGQVRFGRGKSASSSRRSSVGMDALASPSRHLATADSWARKADKTRSEAIRLLIEAGLKRPPKV